MGQFIVRLHPAVAIPGQVMQVGRSGYYDWVNRPAKLITADELMLYRRITTLFKESRESLGSRQMMKRLREEGLTIGRYRTRSMMRRLKLVVKQRTAYKVTTKRKFSDAIADNLLDQQFNPIASNRVWASDITYLRTREGWMYLAIVMDLYSRRIIGWALDKRMTGALVKRAMQMATNLNNLRQDSFSIVTEALSTPAARFPGS